MNNKPFKQSWDRETLAAFTKQSTPFTDEQWETILTELENNKYLWNYLTQIVVDSTYDIIYNHKEQWNNE